MRRITAAAGVVALACASAAPPPGGPPDRAAPRLRSVTPEPGSVRVRPAEVVFRFDEVISERPRGAATLADLVVVSPREGIPQVRWRRTAIAVRPRAGWRENTAYSVTLRRGVSDLRGNAIDTALVVVFSTGATIPATTLRGEAFDWLAGRPAPDARIEAYPRGDTALVYEGATGRDGRFVLRALAPGEYVVRTHLDVNRNGRIDARESWDTASVTLRDSARVSLYAFPHDSLPPRIATVTVRDSVTLRVQFDRPVGAGDRPPVTAFSLVAADSTPVPIAAAYSASEADSVAQARARARDDSAARADTAAARRLAERRRADSLAAARAAAPRAAPDSVPQEPPPVPARPTPLTELTLELGEPLRPTANYRLAVTRLRGLLGAEGPSARIFTTPRREAARPPADTTARPPAPRPPAP